LAQVGRLNQVQECHFIEMRWFGLVNLFGTHFVPVMSSMTGNFCKDQSKYDAGGEIDGISK